MDGGDKTMKSIAISKFKTNALRILNDISKTREKLIITKRGKPLAEIFPYREPDNELIPGQLSHKLLFENDILSPINEQWNSEKLKIPRSNVLGNSLISLTRKPIQEMLSTMWLIATES